MRPVPVSFTGVKLGRFILGHTEEAGHKTRLFCTPDRILNLGNGSHDGPFLMSIRFAKLGRSEASGRKSGESMKPSPLLRPIRIGYSALRVEYLASLPRWKPTNSWSLPHCGPVGGFASAKLGRSEASGRRSGESMKPSPLLRPSGLVSNCVLTGLSLLRGFTTGRSPQRD